MRRRAQQEISVLPSVVGRERIDVMGNPHAKHAAEVNKATGPASPEPPQVDSFKFWLVCVELKSFSGRLHDQIHFYGPYSSHVIDRRIYTSSAR